MSGTSCLEVGLHGTQYILCNVDRAACIQDAVTDDEVKTLCCGIFLNLPQQCLLQSAQLFVLPEVEVLAELVLQSGYLALQITQFLLCVAALGFAHDSNVLLDLGSELIKLFLLCKKLALARCEFFL